MAKWKMTKEHTMIYKTLDKKRKIEQHESHLKPVWPQVLRKGKQFLQTR